MRRVNIECAAAAALAVGLVVFQDMKVESDYNGAPPFPTVETVLTLCLIPGCYLTAAVVPDLLERLFGLHRVPAWMVISILGSLLFSRVYVLHFSSEPLDVARVAYVLSIYTALFTAPIYYSAAIVGLLRKLRRRLASALKSFRQHQ